MAQHYGVLINDGKVHLVEMNDYERIEEYMGVPIDHDYDLHKMALLALRICEAAKIPLDDNSRDVMKKVN